MGTCPVEGKDPTDATAFLPDSESYICYYECYNGKSYRMMSLPGPVFDRKRNPATGPNTCLDAR